MECRLVFMIKRPPRWVTHFRRDFFLALCLQQRSLNCCGTEKKKRKLAPRCVRHRLGWRLKLRLGSKANERTKRLLNVYSFHSANEDFLPFFRHNLVIYDCDELASVQWRNESIWGCLHSRLSIRLTRWFWSDFSQHVFDWLVPVYFLVNLMPRRKTQNVSSATLFVSLSKSAPPPQPPPR